MMRQMFRWTVVIGVVLGALYYAEAGGGGGGGKEECSLKRVQLSWTQTCDRQRRCAGGCFELRWIEKVCIAGNKKCERTTMSVNRVMYRADCEFRPSDPTCGCKSTYTPIGPWDTITVPWCF